ISSDVTFEEAVFPHRTRALELPPFNDSNDEYIDLPLPDSDDETVSTTPQDLTKPPPTNAPQPAMPSPSPVPEPPVQLERPAQQPVRTSTRITRGQRRKDPTNASRDAERAQRAIQPRAGPSRRPWIGNIDAYLMASNVTPTGDPATYKAALQTPEAPMWIKAMEEEIENHKENGTWILTDLPEARKTVKCKWVYLTKRDLEGKPVRYKARLIAKGYTQQAGIDYEETFAPVARLDSLQFLLALAATMDWEVHQIDIKTAFFSNGTLEEEIYMDQPEGFAIPGQESKVGLLVKTIYGLKQAGRRWYEHLRQTLIEAGFQELLASDVSIFFLHEENGDITIILVYVDDMAIFATTLELVSRFKDLIKMKYKYTDLGEIKQFLGLSIIRDRKNKTVSIDQSHYIRRIVERFNMTNSRFEYSPMAQNNPLTTNDGEEYPDIRQRYQSMVGSLMYAMLGSRPDICFAITKLSQFGSNPTEEHLHAAQRALRYLNATVDFKLVYGTVNSTDIEGYSDSDWASDVNNRISTTGYVYALNGGAIAWASRKQRTVALSSTEAEYMALTETCKHAKWMLNLCNQLSFDVDLPVEIRCDSKGAKDITENPVFHKRTKHIDIQHHFIPQQVEEGVISIYQVPSAENLADLFTKPLARNHHLRLAKSIGLEGSLLGENGNIEVESV
ncbi:MAG TPA: reverse transcriptase domain-containing protein, partial [Chlamydiales bacterium]|nr:reverse transcriptase domain-containing protein [Chlamydiales bacterium]